MKILAFSILCMPFIADAGLTTHGIDRLMYLTAKKNVELSQCSTFDLSDKYGSDNLLFMQNILNTYMCQPIGGVYKNVFDAWRRTHNAGISEEMSADFFKHFLVVSYLTLYNKSQNNPEDIKYLEKNVLSSFLNRYKNYQNNDFYQKYQKRNISGLYKNIDPSLLTMGINSSTYQSIILEQWLRYHTSATDMLLLDIKK